MPALGVPPSITHAAGLPLGSCIMCAMQGQICGLKLVCVPVWGAALLLHATAQASPVAAGLLCARLDGADRAAFADFVRSKGKPAGDGVVKIAGPVRDQGFCVRNVTVIGAFGVVVATGQACADDGEAFVASIGSVLRRAAAPGAQAGEMARFDVANGARPKGDLLVYRGRPAPQPRPDVRARTLAYHCVREDGGAQ
jgi:hypothetical protein